jgi:hypothetical protein
LLGWVAQADRHSDTAQVLVGESVATAPEGASQVPLGEPLTASGSRSVNEYSVLQQRRLAAGDRTRAGAPIGYGAGHGLLSLILGGFGNRPGHPRSQRGPKPIGMLGYGG